MAFDEFNHNDLTADLCRRSSRLLSRVVCCQF